jgi:hypothetical protein
MDKLQKGEIVSVVHAASSKPCSAAYQPAFYELGSLKCFVSLRSFRENLQLILGYKTCE